MIKYSTIKELRFLQEDTYVMYYVGSSVGSCVVVVFLRVTLCSVFLLRLLCFFLFFLPSVICALFLSRVVLILLKYCLILWLDRAVIVLDSILDERFVWWCDTSAISVGIGSIEFLPFLSFLFFSSIILSISSLFFKA